MTRIVAAAFALFTLAACGHSVEYTPLAVPPRPLEARSPESVAIFLSGPPPRPFVEVGLFEIEQRHPRAGGTPGMLAKLRTHAAREGCDALVVTAATDRVQSVVQQTQGTVQHDGAGGARYSGVGSTTENHVRGHRAVCIVYTGAELDAARAAVAPGASPPRTPEPPTGTTSL